VSPPGPPRRQRQLQVGLGFQSDKRADDYAQLGALAEAYGFDTVSVFGDLLYQPPLWALLVIAQHTQRVRLGPACLNPYLLHPVEIAGQIATLDLACGGRAFLGLARGAWLGQAGVAQPRPLRTLREAAEVVACLLEGDDRGYAGEVFALQPGTRLRYRPQRPRVELLLGTWGPRGTALAGELADELKLGGCANPAMVATARERLTAACQAAGRIPDAAGIVAGAVTVVDDDGAAARSRARAEVAMYLAVVAGLDPTAGVPADLVARVRVLVAQGEHEAAGRAIPDDVLDQFAFSGTPEQVAAQAAGLFDAGAQRVDFGAPHGLTDLQGVDLLGSRVLPLLRARSL
jgi:5,10-methylenetetrahydromethanopterin reductase